MVEELHGKISSTGSNLHDRLEDKLTGDIFGTLRYLPFQAGIGPVLAATDIPALRKVATEHSSEAWADCIHFWPYSEEGELDVRIDLPGAVIGIEVKLHAGLSMDSDREQADDPEQSRDQLAREARIIRRAASSKQNRFLILLADEALCAMTRQAKPKIIQKVTLGFLSWQDVLCVLQEQLAQAKSPYARCILKDLTDLLIRKGFERFQGFRYEPECALRATEYFAYTYVPEYALSSPGQAEIHGGSYYVFE